MSDEDYSEEIKRAGNHAVIRHLDGTPNDELRELIEEWRDEANEDVISHKLKACQKVLESVADELEELIDHE